MPYIQNYRREDLESGYYPDTPGELNFVFTEIIKKYIERCGLSYGAINDVVGALECCKLEFVRRVVNDYEDSKIAENGDVY